MLGDRPLSRTFAVFLPRAGAFIAGSVLGGGAGLGVTIQSTYQDNVFLDAIRPHGVTELERHIEEKKAVLTELGISFYSYGRHYGGH